MQTNTYPQKGSPVLSFDKVLKPMLNSFRLKVYRSEGEHAYDNLKYTWIVLITISAQFRAGCEGCLIEVRVVHIPYVTRVNRYEIMCSDTLKY